MITLGSLGFLSPWLLAGLAALPAIWWLLRLTPPAPHRVVFPPTRLLKDLKSTEETPAHSPWWLTALRMLLAALIVLALARPVLNPDRQSIAGAGPLVLVIDNGWASAAHWPLRREAIEAAIDRAASGDHTVVLAPTAPGDPVTGPVSASQARESAAGLAPQPYAPDRAALAAALERELGNATDYSVLWLSDGLDYGDAQDFAARLKKLAGATGSLSVLNPEGDDGALAVNQATGAGSELCRKGAKRHARSPLRRGARAHRPRRPPGRGELHRAARGARDQGRLRPAARDPQSGRAAGDRRRAIGGRRASSRRPLRMAPRRHRLRRIARGSPAAALATLLCAARAFALRRRRGAERAQRGDRGA